jgi:hypothetical protein
VAHILTARKLRTYLLVIFINSLILFSSNSFQPVQAEYAIEEGDTFTFDILKLRSEFNIKMIFQLQNLVFEEGNEIKMKFTQVEPPYISFSLTTKNETVNGLTVFSENIVLNRDWDELTQEYENYGYVVEEGIDFWKIIEYVESPTSPNQGFISATYSKIDGVISELFILHYPEVLDETNIDQLKIERQNTPTRKNLFWLFTLALVIPIGFGIYIYIKKKKEKVNKDDID